MARCTVDKWGLEYKHTCVVFLKCQRADFCYILTIWAVNSFLKLPKGMCYWDREVEESICKLLEE